MKKSLKKKGEADLKCNPKNYTKKFGTLPKKIKKTLKTRLEKWGPVATGRVKNLL
jgi:hypothetical protein